LQVSPKVFKLDAKMIAEVIDPQGDSDERILFAAKLCPTKAISLEEEGSGKKIFPPD
jgi:ferredoxin